MGVGEGEWKGRTESVLFFFFCFFEDARGGGTDTTYQYANSMLLVSRLFLVRRAQESAGGFDDLPPLCLSLSTGGREGGMGRGFSCFTHTFVGLL